MSAAFKKSSIIATRKRAIPSLFRGSKSEGGNSVGKLIGICMDVTVSHTLTAAASGESFGKW
jgi:hypothetical protein